MAFAAIWLTIVAPVISRVLPAPHAAAAMSDMACAQHTGHAADPAPPHPGLPSTDKCGYCGLLGQSPLLVAVAWAPALLPQVAHQPPPLPDTSHAQGHSLLAPTPRGPPVLVNA